LLSVILSSSIDLSLLQLQANHQHHHYHPMNDDIIDSDFLVLSLLITIGMQMTFFAIAMYFKFDKVTDIAGSMNFVLLAWLFYGLRGTFYTRQLYVKLA
jgi:hypothetical protein